MKMSTYTHVPFCRCFGVTIVEPSKILAVCLVFVTAHQTQQPPKRHKFLKNRPIDAQLVCARLHALGKQLKLRTPGQSGTPQQRQQKCPRDENLELRLVRGSCGPPLRRRSTSLDFEVRPDSFVQKNRVREERLFPEEDQIFVDSL